MASIKFSINETPFQQLLRRNIVLPFLIGTLSTLIFFLLIWQLLSVAKLLARSDQIIQSAHGIEKMLIEVQTNFRGYLLSNDKDYLEAYHAVLAKVPPEIEELKMEILDSPTQLQRVNRIENKYLLWEQRLKQVENLRRYSPGYSSVVKENLKTPIMSEIAQEIDDFIRDESRVRIQRNDIVTHSVKVALIAVAILNLFGGALLVRVGKRQLMMLSGEYEKALQNLKDKNTTLNEQGWLRAGHTDISSQIRGEYSTTEIASKSLHYIARYLKADIGSFYVENDLKFELVSTYGYLANDDKKSFFHGEGLIGQTALNKDIQVIQDLPAGYCKISSSIGESTPRFLMIVPLQSDNHVNCMMELGFLSTPPELSYEFLNLVSESISVAVKSAKYRERLETLLHEVQSQAEELQSQQEELQEANRQLEEQTVALKETKAYLETQQIELQKTNESLEKTSRYKSEFLANMSHELRTPLNSLLILSTLLGENKEHNLSTQQIEFAKQIYKSGHDLLRLINDILDLSKVEAGRLEVFPEHFLLTQFMSDIENFFKAAARESGLEFEVVIEKNVPENLYTDGKRLEQILRNLISNAIKFTSHGKVTLRAFTRTEDSVSFSVTDTGIGIPKDQLSAIFEPFHQADRTISRKYGGTGLGLPISRDLARLLKGCIQVESQPQVGSTFTLNIPINLEKSGHVILVVEDDPVQSKSLSTLISAKGLRAAVAPTATKALTMLDNLIVDYVIVDLNLPDMPGSELIKRIAARKKHPPLIVYTAQELSDAEKARLQQDSDAVIVKGKASPEQLIEEVHTRLRFPQFETISTTPNRDLEKLSPSPKLVDQILAAKKIMLVDDDLRHLFSMVSSLEEHGAQVIVARNGCEALEKLQQQKNVDLIISDIMMPKMNGRELIQKIRESGMKVPIIIVTASGSEEEKQKCLQAGADLFLAKPMTASELLKHLKKWLSSQEECPRLSEAPL